MAKPRVLIVANKWWECDPIANVLLHEKARPRMPVPELEWPARIDHPHRRVNPNGDPRSTAPRLVYDTAACAIELWCISDLLEDLPDASKHQSSTERKAERLPMIFRDGAALVMAVGTGATLPDVQSNGCVVVGTNVFIHDGHPNGDNPDSRWRGGPFERIVPSTLSAAAFDTLTAFPADVSLRLLSPPNNPAPAPSVIAGHALTAIGDVNVTNYGEYAAKDQDALDSFAANGGGAPAGTIETTHGLIRVQSDAPFLFVSGIPNRMGHLGDEVTPREYAQNFVAAHNAGIVVAWMLPRIHQLFTSPGVSLRSA